MIHPENLTEDRTFVMVYAIYSTHTLYLLHGVTQILRIRHGLCYLFNTYSILTARCDSESAHSSWFMQFIQHILYTYCMELLRIRAFLMVYAIYSKHTILTARCYSESAHSSWFMQFIQHILYTYCTVSLRICAFLMVYAIYSTHTLYLLHGVTQNPRIHHGLCNLFNTYSILTARCYSESARY